MLMTGNQHYWRYAISAPADFLAFGFAQKLFALNKKSSREPLRSPRGHSLSQKDVEKSPYPLDVFPGGRDIDTPYGSIRVFEWGPEDGRKVLFVHGISVPAMSMGGLAHELADKGCRVIIFDLFGRGYSDTPVDLPHDIRLYTSQILLVEVFPCLFTRYLPHFVQSLTIIAPGGLMRSHQIGWRSKILYSEGIFPETLLRKLVKWRVSPQSSITPYPPPDPQDPEAAVMSELSNVQANKDSGNSDISGGDSYDNARLSQRHPHITVSSIVSWQLANHAGFIPTFMSNIRHAPIYNQDEDWKIVGTRLRGQNTADEACTIQGLHKNKVLMILGATDPVIDKDQTINDAKSVLVVVLDVGHEIPFTKAAEAADAIWKFWTED